MVITADRPTFICLTPVRNEAWILDRFLRCAATWADQIILLDQKSDDGSREIAQSHPKVILLDNTTGRYDEGARQRLLLDAARQVPCAGRRILIALDADEMLSADWATSTEWRQVLAATPGTVLQFDWVNLLPGFKRAWIPSDPIPLGFVDDGSAHEGEAIHSRRLPAPSGAPVLRMREVSVLHYQYLAWERMRSKQRWYQCWERIHHPHKRPIAIFRQYNAMYGRPTQQIHPFRPQWIAGYEQAGIPMRDVKAEGEAWWDREVACWIAQRGAAYFRKEAVWDVDWASIARSSGIAADADRFSDPRSAADKLVHRWLRATQHRCLNSGVRFVQRALIPLGW